MYESYTWITATVLRVGGGPCGVRPLARLVGGGARSDDFDAEAGQAVDVALDHVALDDRPHVFRCA